MSIGWGIAQGTLDALPYSMLGAAVTYVGGATRFTIPMALTVATVVWIVLFLIGLTVSLNRYRTSGKSLPITRVVVYHTLWAIPG